MPTKLLIDGNHLTGRCRATLGDMATSKGVYSGALYGFFKGLFWVEKEIQVEHRDVVVCWDFGRAEKRKAIYPDYKGGREPEAPTEEQEVQKLAYIYQLNALHHGLAFTGCRQVRVRGVEADDLIGIISRFYEEQEFEVVIYSGDHDMHQLVSDRVRVFDVNAGMLGVPEVLQKWEVPSIEHIPYYKAITGDKSDNIKGIGGVGHVNATLLLNCLTFENGNPTWKLPIPSKAQKAVAKFGECRDTIVRNLRLMRIPRYWQESLYSDTEQIDALSQLVSSGSFQNDLELIRFFKTWELNSILEEYRRW